MTRKGKLIPSQGTPPSACHHGQHAHSKEGQWDGERWVVPFTSKLKQLARSCRLPLRSFCYSHFLFPIMTGTYGVYNLASVLCIHNETTLKCCNGFSLIWRSVCQPRPTKDTHPWSFTSVIHCHTLSAKVVLLWGHGQLIGTAGDVIHFLCSSCGKARDCEPEVIFRVTSEDDNNWPHTTVIGFLAVCVF